MKRMVEMTKYNISCFKCHTHTDLSMYPQRLDTENSIVGWIFSCSSCVDINKDITILSQVLESEKVVEVV